MDELKKMAALTALNNMMDKGHFSICTVDNVAKMLGIRCQGEAAYSILNTVHCVDFAKMPAELRAKVPELIQECLGIAPVYQFKTMDQQVIDVEPAPERRGVLRFLGRNQ